MSQKELISIGILRRGETVLIGLRAANRANYAGCWSFPGGHLEADETPRAALDREFVEELAVEINTCAAIDTLQDTGLNGVVSEFHVFLVDCWYGTPAIQNDEHSTLKWASLRDASWFADMQPAGLADTLTRLASQL
ncbi:MAG: 8-oxo-dGTP diphosphatase [Paracoccaceae bacterium]